MQIIMKPHHFMDIIKLYGSGIEVFVPAKDMGHDFYRIGNIIIGDHSADLRLTVGSDDICTPCVMCKDHECVDGLDKIPGFSLKGVYNKALDSRLMEELKLDTGRSYKADELCRIMLSHHECVYSVWQEEDDLLTERRHDFFVAGAKKYLALD